MIELLIAWRLLQIKISPISSKLCCSQSLRVVVSRDIGFKPTLWSNLHWMEQKWLDRSNGRKTGMQL